MASCVENDRARIETDVLLGIDIKPKFKYCRTDMLCEIGFNAMSNKYFVRHGETVTTHETRLEAEDKYGEF